MKGPDHRRQSPRGEERIGQPWGERLVHVDHIEGTGTQMSHGSTSSQRGDRHRGNRSVARKRYRRAADHQIDPLGGLDGTVRRCVDGDSMATPLQAAGQAEDLPLHATWSRKAVRADKRHSHRRDCAVVHHQDLVSPSWNAGAADST